MEELILKNGRKLMVYEFSFRGMAGEVNTILHAKWADDNRQVQLKKVMHLMSERDNEMVTDWINSLGLYNEQNAIAWVY